MVSDSKAFSGCWCYLLGRVSVRILAPIMILMTFLVIILGGIIRIYDAGESCPDWPKCFGTWGFDISEEDQGIWYEENPNEIDSRGSSHRYTTFQIFTEWIHRFVAGVILGPLVLFNRWLASREGRSSEVKFASTVAVIMIIIQGMIGWLTVKMDNENWSVVIHLGNALLFTLSLIWVWVAAMKEEGKLIKLFRLDEKYNSKWKARLFWISFGTLITLFSGTFVSTTPGANLSCGVNGLFGSWPLCNGYFAERIENIVDQSQMIHRWFVVLMQIALFWLSYKIWEENSESNSDDNLRFWIWSSTGVYFTNILMGAFYVLSWTLDNGHIEILSLIHLLFATISFLLLATASLLLALNTKKEMKYSALET